VRTTQSWLPPFSKKPIAASARSESGVKPPNFVWNSSNDVQSTACPMGPRSVMPTAPATDVGAEGMPRTFGSSSTMTTLDDRSCPLTMHLACSSSPC
jgi:hypothetical protein